MKIVAVNNSLIDAAKRLDKEETPYMLTDLDIIQQNCKRFRENLPSFRLFYAVKALFTDEIVRAMDGLVDGFDVASQGEIQRLLNLGVSVDRLHFSNPVKSVQSITTAHAIGIASFTVQSRQELEKIATNAPKSKIFVRVKLDDTHSLVPLSQKFGCGIDEVKPLFELAKNLGLVPYGIAFHVGSQVLDVNVWDGAIKQVSKLVRMLNEEGIKIQAINIGGGFPTRYFNDDTEITSTASHIKKNIQDDMKDLLYIAEPGRYVVANSSVIVSTVIGTELRGGENWLFLDTGLFQSFLGAVRYEIFPYRPISLRQWGEVAVEQQLYTLTGPTCDSEDIIAVDVMLPKDIVIGDRLVFPNVGAYTIVYGSSFNGFALPKQKYLKEGKISE
ncbi:MAG TPA: type III PLP-dependent enzyme [Candidatus Saccharimonadales bacterium]